MNDLRGYCKFSYILYIILLFSLISLQNLLFQFFFSSCLTTSIVCSVLFFSKNQHPISSLDLQFSHNLYRLPNLHQNWLILKLLWVSGSVCNFFRCDKRRPAFCDPCLPSLFFKYFLQFITYLSKYGFAYFCCPGILILFTLILAS